MQSKGVAPDPTVKLTVAPSDPDEILAKTAAFTAKAVESVSFVQPAGVFNDCVEPL